MPRSKRPTRSAQFKTESLSVPPNRAVVASATNFKVDAEKRTQSRTQFEGWQTLIWNYFDTVPEFHYACTWVGNMLSKARLYPMDADGKEITSGPAFDAMQEFFGGPEGQREFLRNTGIHFTAVGEQYVIGVEETDTTEADWLVAAAVETTRQGKNWRVDQEEFLDPFVFRMWRSHPRKRRFSDSPARAALPILAELDGLTKRVAATIDSRLAGAGILAIPNEITFVNADAVDANGNVSTDASGSAQQFVKNLLHTMATGIQDRESAAALVPIVLQMPGEYVDKVKLISLASDLDDKAKELRDEAIRRLALGMDMPPEVLEGTADMNHWSSWQVEEAAIKTHSEPLLALVAAAVLEGFLVPALGSDPLASTVGIGVDDTELRLRPNRSAEAIELYDRGALSKKAMLRENGFSDSDAMSNEEYRTWLLGKIAGGSATPDQVAAAAAFFKVEIPSGVTEPSPTAQDTRESRPTPSLEQHPTRALPDSADGNGETDPTLIAGAGILVHRALERAGNKFRGKSKVHRAESSAKEYLASRWQESELSYLLDDAWTDAVVAFSEEINMPAANVVALLDSYTRALILTQQEHSPDRFREFVTRRAAA